MKTSVIVKDPVFAKVAEENDSRELVDVELGVRWVVVEEGLGGSGVELIVLLLSEVELGGWEVDADNVESVFDDDDDIESVEIEEEELVSEGGGSGGSGRPGIETDGWGRSDGSGIEGVGVSLPGKGSSLQVTKNEAEERNEKEKGTHDFEWGSTS